MIYTFRFDQAAIALIGEALGALPHRQVAVLVGNIQQQIDMQEAAASAAASAGNAAGSPVEVAASAAEVAPSAAESDDDSAAEAAAA